jgi:hypothetical protein
MATQASTAAVPSNSGSPLLNVKVQPAAVIAAVKIGTSERDPVIAIILVTGHE